MNAVAGRRPETYGLEPFRFDQMRPGCYDVDARVHDMDINGVWASVNFPSMITGFCGRVFFDARDRDLGLACVRAWNDWLFEEWYSAHPDRIVPLGITYLADPELAVAEIRRNAERGFTSVTFPERPHEIGLPSLWDRSHWDPIMEAVVDTDTVVSLHVGSSGLTPAPPGAGMDALQLGATLFGQLSLIACAEWLWSGYAAAPPDAQDRHERGGHRLGGHAARPARQHRRPLPLRARLGRAPGRRAAAQLLVLHHRRPVDHRHAPRHRGRPHHGGGRLPARRQHLARHPGRH